MFDILYLDGKSLLKEPYPKRRALLEENIKESDKIHLARRIVTDSLEEIEDFLNETVEKGLEGIVIKSVSKASVYEAGFG